jgi:hypothetical protein
MIAKLYLNTETANAPIGVVLFLAVNSDFCIVLNRLKPSGNFTYHQV